MDSMSQASRHSYAYQHQHHQHAPSTPPEHDQLEEPENYDDEDEDDKLGVEGGGKDGEPPKKKRRRQALSCTECKRRKIKCDRNHPCGPCTRRGEMTKCRWTVVEPLEKFVTRGEWEEMRRKVAYLESLVMPLVAAQSHPQPPSAPPSYGGPPPPPPPPAVPVPPPPPPAPVPPAQPAYAYSHPSQHARHYAPQPPQPPQPPHVPAVPPVPAVQHMSQGSDDSPASRPGTGHTAGSSGHGHGGGQPGWNQAGYSYTAAHGEEEGRSGKRRKASVPAPSAPSGQDSSTYDSAYGAPGYDYPGRPFPHPAYAHHPGHHPHPYHMQHGHALPPHPPPPFGMGFGHPFAHHPGYHGGPPPPRHAGVDVEMKEGAGYGYASGHHGYAAGPPSTGPPAQSSSKRGGSRIVPSSSSSSGPASGFVVHSVGGRRNSPPPPPPRRVSPPPSPARRASLPASRFEHGRRTSPPPSSPPRLASRSHPHSVGRSSPIRLAAPIPPSRARPSSPSSGSSRPPAPATASTTLASSSSLPSRLMSHPRSLPSRSSHPPSQPRPPSPSSRFHLNPLPSINQLALGLPAREMKDNMRSSSEGRNEEDGDWEMDDTRNRELPPLRAATGKAKAEVEETGDRSGASTPTPSTGRPTISSGASRAGALKDEPGSEDIRASAPSNAEEPVTTASLDAAGADGDGASTNNSTLPNFPSNALGFIAMTGLGMAARGKGRAGETAGASTSTSAGASTSTSAGASTSTASSSLTRPDTDRVRAYPAGTADPYLGVAGASTSQTIGAISADREVGSGAGVRRRTRDWEPGKGTAYYPHMSTFLRQPSSATPSSKWAPRGSTMPVGVGMLLDVDLLSSAEAGGADGELLVLSAGVEQAVVDTDVEMVDAAT